MGTIIVIGGGPAGMMAAGTAAEHGANVVLLEKNEKPGKKLYITGKGRCNVTNACGKDELLSAVMSNPRFMQSAFSAFGTEDTVAFFESRGVKLKTERGRRVFPVSDKSSDITRALESAMRKAGVKTLCGHQVLSIDESFNVNTNRGEFRADAVIVATGGLSYPVTGSTGDGYKFASRFGHTIKDTYPALVPLVVREPWVAEAEGLALKNVRCSVGAFSEVGEMMFTANGITGPLILTASRFVTDKFGQDPGLSIDLKPGLDFPALDERVLRDFAENTNKIFQNSLDKLLPGRLIKIIAELSGISPFKKVNTITKQERLGLVSLLKTLRLTPISTAGFNEAVITAGGVSVKEVNPSSMMSKKAAGLFFAGEVLDVDAVTGGYNLQIAFSTGYLAGKSAAGFETGRLK